MSEEEEESDYDSEKVCDCGRIYVMDDNRDLESSDDEEDPAFNLVHEKPPEKE